MAEAISMADEAAGRPGGILGAGSAVDLFLLVKEGHVEVVRTVGGRELAMMNRNEEVSCHSISAEKGIWMW